MQKFRMYADGSIVHEDDFSERDNSQPFYDDYGTYEIPDELIDHIVEINRPIQEYFVSYRMYYADNTGGFWSGSFVFVHSGDPEKVLNETIEHIRTDSKKQCGQLLNDHVNILAFNKV